MPRIARKAQQQFAGGIPAAGNIAIFGSTAAGGLTTSNDPAAIQSAAFLLGWQAATIGNGSPVIQDRNAVDFLFAYQTAYLLQQGLAEWDPTTPYFVNNFAAVNGVIYISKTDNNLNNLVTDTNNWKTLASTLGIPSPVAPAALAAAWIVFDGTTGGGFQAFNCNIAKTGTGEYTATFPVSFLIEPVIVGNCQGLVRPVLPGTSAFAFDTASLAGGVFSPHDFTYVSVVFYGAQ